MYHDESEIIENYRVELARLKQDYNILMEKGEIEGAKALEETINLIKDRTI